MPKLTFAISARLALVYDNEGLVYSGDAYDTMQTTSVVTPSMPGGPRWVSERPQTTAYALCDSPSGLLAYMLASIPPASPCTPISSAGSPVNLRSPTVAASSPVSLRGYGTPRQDRSSRSSDSPPGSLPISKTENTGSPWTATALVDWTMPYWAPGPETALRWRVNSIPLIPHLWQTHSRVPLGISYFEEPTPPWIGSVQTPPSYAYAYHSITMVRERWGRVRFAAWEQPVEVVQDLREFAQSLGFSFALAMPVAVGL